MSGKDKLDFFHVREFLLEKNLLKTVQSLESESGFYLDISHVESLICQGDWNNLRNYISGFFGYGDDSTTMEISFMIKKQQFFEALKKGNMAEGVAILFEEGNTFRHIYQERLNDLLLLTIADDPWNNELSSGYKSETISRFELCKWIEYTFQNHPGIREKMKFPNVSPGPAPPCSNMPAAMVPLEELPMKTLIVISQDFVLTCFDFHPVHEDFLAVGATGGEVYGKKIGFNGFKWIKDFQVVKPLDGYTEEFQSVCVNRSAVNSVSCLRWSPSGRYLGVGFSKHLFQLMEFRVNAGFRVESEIEAHRGSVNDIVFYNRNGTPFIVTCGQDKLVKIWNQTNMLEPFITLEGHFGSVASVCFFERNQVGFVASSDMSGRTKMWDVDDPEKRFDLYSHQCRSTEVMSNRGDGASFFTIDEKWGSMPYISEWLPGDKSVGVTCKCEYHGMGETALHRSDNNGKILVAATKDRVDFWDIKFGQHLSTNRMSPPLQGTPLVRVSKRGLFLAVAVSECRVKIFGNLEGLKLAFSHASTLGEPFMPRSKAWDRLEDIARGLGVANLKHIMANYDVPSFSIERATAAEFGGHPQMVTSSAVPELRTDDIPPSTGMLNANAAAPYPSTAGASNPRMRAAQVGSSSSSKDKPKFARHV